MIVANTALGLLLMLEGANVHAVEWRGRPSAVDCGKRLEFGLNVLLTHSNPLVHVGNYTEIRDLLVNSGYPRAFAEEVLELIRLALESSNDSGNILFQIAEGLKEVARDEQRLLVCVAENCGLHDRSTAAHFIVPKDFKIRPFRASGIESAKTGWVENKAQDDLMMPQGIVIGWSAERVSIQWASYFLHEAAHMSDFKLIKEWIAANVRLLERAELPDERFGEFVRIKAGQLPVVDEGFMRLFLESRAYQAQELGFRRILPNHVYSMLRKRSRNMAFKDIQGYRGVAGYLIERYQLREDNVFEIGERLAREMRRTIAQAHARS